MTTSRLKNIIKNIFTNLFIIIAILVFIIIVVWVFYMMPKVWPELTGKVFNYDTQKPIPNAIVVVNWYGHAAWSGDSCLHVETAMTDSKGNYSIPSFKNTSRTRNYSHQYTKYFVYKPNHYKISELPHSVGYIENNTFYLHGASYYGKDIPSQEKTFVKNIYMNKWGEPGNTRTNEEKIKHIRDLMRSTSCFAGYDSNHNLLTLYKTLYKDATKMAPDRDSLYTICRKMAYVANRKKLHETESDKRVAEYLKEHNPECLKLKVDPEENKRVLTTFLSGDKHRINELIDKGFKIDRIFYPNTTALMVAAKQARLQTIRALIELGANPNIEIRHQPHILQQILNEKKLTEKDKINVINLLVKLGADIHVIDKRTDISLALAAGIGNINIITSLINNGAVVNPVSKTTKYHVLYLHGQPPLKFAKNIKVAKLLIDAGADPTIHFTNDVSLLMNAAKYSKSEIVKLLVQEGAQVNKLDNAGNSALMYTMYKYHMPWSFGYPDIARNFGHPDTPREFGHPDYKREKEIFEKLFNNNKEKILDTIRVLIKLGGDVNQKNKSGEKLIDFSKDPDFRALIRNGHKIH